MTSGNDLEHRMDRAERVLAALADAQEATQTSLRTLTTSQVFITESIEKMVRASTRADERITEVGDKLDALIAIMDQHLRDHHECRA